MSACLRRMRRTCHATVIFQGAINESLGFTAGLRWRRASVVVVPLSGHSLTTSFGVDPVLGACQRPAIRCEGDVGCFYCVQNPGDLKVADGYCLCPLVKTGSAGLSGTCCWFWVGSLPMFAFLVGGPAKVEPLESLKRGGMVAGTRLPRSDAHPGGRRMPPLVGSPGHGRQSSMAEIWNGDRARHFREARRQHPFGAHIRCAARHRPKYAIEQRGGRPLNRDGWRSFRCRSAGPPATVGFWPPTGRRYER